VIVIKRLAIALLALFVLAIIAVASGKFVSDVLRKGPLDAEGKAISIALSDPNVKYQMAQNNVRAITESKPYNSTLVKGFINLSARLIAVHVALRSPTVPPPDDNFYFIIDVSTGQIVDKIGFFDVAATADEITIPAGSAWYYDISRPAFRFENGSTFVSFWALYYPEYAAVYMEIVDREGLEKLRNTPASVPLQEIDVSEHRIAFNSTVPPNPGWSGTVDIPPTGGGCYMVFINGEKDRMVNLTLSMPLAGTVYY